MSLIVRTLESPLTKTRVILTEIEGQAKVTFADGKSDGATPRQAIALLYADKHVQMAVCSGLNSWHIRATTLKLRN